MIEKYDVVKNMQKKLLPMLKWFHEFCLENNLRYYALGGDYAGAVRHKGFIPWDDDIDVGMPREDYDRFISLCKNKKFGNYVVEVADKNNKDFFFGYGKIYDVSTTLIEHGRYNIKRGIFIDLFLLDGVGNNVKEAFEFCRPIYLKYQLLMTKTCALSKNRVWYKNIAIILGRCIPSTIFNSMELLIKIDGLCRTYKYDECQYVANIFGNWGTKEIVKKDIMGVPQIYTFEGIEIYGVEKYDQYLTSLYGEWRKLPPENQQISHHDFVYLNLSESFLQI